jgi:hypothetical protein
MITVEEFSQGKEHFSCLKSPYKIPPNLPLPKGGEKVPPFDKGG